MEIVKLQTTADTQKPEIASLFIDDSFKISEKEKELNYQQQEEAFGSIVTSPIGAKQMAAEELAKENAQKIIDLSLENLRNMSSNLKMEEGFFRVTEPLTNASYLEDVALPVLAADSTVAEAELDNPDDIGSLSDEDTLFTAEDRAKADMEALIMDKANNLLSSQGIGKTLWQIGQRFIPFVQSVKDWRTSDDNTFHVLPTKVRKAQRQKILAAKEKMSAIEYGKFLNGEFDRLVKEGHDGFAIQEYFEDIFTHNTRFEDVMQALDIFSVGKLVTGGNKVSRILKAGNKTKAVQAVQEASTADKLGHVLPSIAKPAEGPTTTLAAVVEDVEHTKIANQKALEALEDTLTYQYTPSQEALSKYVDVVSKEFQNRLPKSKKKTIDTNLMSVEKDADGTYDLVVTIGNGLDGTSHFKSQEAALEYIAKETKLVGGEYDVIRDAEGYLVKARTKVPFTGKIMDEKAFGKEGKPFKLKGIGRYLLGRIGVPDEFHEANNIAVNSIARLRAIGQDMLQPIKNLKGKDLENFNVIQAKQLNDQAWLDPEVLQMQGYSTAVIEANKAFRDISDIGYIVENAGVRKKLTALGFKRIKANTESTEFIGKIVNRVSDAATSTFKDIETGTVYQIGQLTDEKMEELTKAGKVFAINNAVDVDIDAEVPIKYYILDKAKATVADLPAYVVDYVPGGRRYYAEGTLFAKLPRTLMVGDKRTVIKPKTLFAGLDKQSMTAKVKEINAALDEYQRYMAKEITRKELNQRLDRLAAVADHFKASSLTELKEVLGKNIDPTLRVEIVEDGQTLAQVRKLKSENVASLVDDELFFSSSMSDLFETNGMLYTRRGLHLKDVDGSYSKILSAEDTAKKTLDKLIHSQAYDEYNRMYASEFRRLFGDVIDPYDLAHMSDVDLLKGGRFIDLQEGSKNKALRNKINAAKHMQKKWQLVTEQPTEFDKMISAHTFNLAQKLGEAFPNTMGRGTAGYTAIAKAKPTEFIRSLAFHQYLGCFNPRQIVTQAMGGISVLAMEPLHGLNTVALYPALRMAMTTDNVEHLSAITKAVARLGGVSTEDFKDIVKTLKKIGAYNAEDVQVFVDARNILNTNALKKASTFFFREGERFNSIVAYGAAVLKHKKMLGHVPSTYDELSKAAAYGQELYLNMSRASTTPFQKGTYLPSHLFAQFTSYPMRFIEALFNKKLTRLQRTSLLLTNMACFGVAGVLGRDVVTAAYQKGKEFLGVEGSLEYEFEVLNGMLDTIAKDYGVDVTFSNLAPNLFDKPWQIVVDGDMQLPAISGLGSLWDTAVAISKFLYPTTTDKDLMNLAHWVAYESKSLPTLRNGTKALLAHATGKLYTSNYRVLTNEVGPLESVLYGLGFKSRTEQVYSDAIRYIINKNETIEDVIADLKAAYRKFIHTGSKTAADEFSILHKATLQSIPDSWRPTLLKEMSSIYREFPAPVLTTELARAFRSGDITLYETIKENQ